MPAGAAWQRAIRSARDLRISVNTSARELVEGSFVEGVQAALAESGLAPASLTLEITESMMLADETAAIASLRRLRELGRAHRRRRLRNRLLVAQLPEAVAGGWR